MGEMGSQRPCSRVDAEDAEWEGAERQGDAENLLRHGTVLLNVKFTSAGWERCRIHI